MSSLDITDAINCAERLRYYLSVLGWDDLVEATEALEEKIRMRKDEYYGIQKPPKQDQEPEKPTEVLESRVKLKWPKCSQCGEYLDFEIDRDVGEAYFECGYHGGRLDIPYDLFEKETEWKAKAVDQEPEGD